jgi:hypothetical protein
MNAEDLQNWASFLRWAGLVVTAIGLFLTLGSQGTHPFTGSLAMTSFNGAAFF